METGFESDWMDHTVVQLAESSSPEKTALEEYAAAAASARWRRSWIV